MPAVPNIGTMIIAAERPKREKPSKEIALATFICNWMPTYCLKRVAWSFTIFEPGL